MKKQRSSNVFKTILVLLCIVFASLGTGIVNAIVNREGTKLFAEAAVDNSIFTFVATSETECNVRLKDKTVETAIVPSKVEIDGSEYTVTSVVSNGFISAKNLTKVWLPRTIKSIGSGAFAGCKLLSSVTLSSVESIGSNAFSLCSSLEYLIIPESVKEVSSTILRSSSTKVYIRVSEERTQELGWDENWNDGNETQEVEYNSNFIPQIEYVEVVNSYYGLRPYAEEESVYYVDDFQPFTEALNGKTTIRIPAVYNNKIVAGIKDNAFIDNQVDTIIVEYSENDFYIGSNAFLIATCNKIIINRNITLDDGNGNLSESLFSGSTVKTIVLPDTITDIGPAMFQGCEELTDIQFITPNNNFLGKEEDLIQESTGKIVLPNSVNSIGNEAFSQLPLITSIDIPDSVTEVGERILVDWGGNQVVNINVENESDLYTNGKNWNSNWKDGCSLDVLRFQGTYQITYVLNGGTHTGNPTEYKSFENIILNDAEKKGYTFDGWYDNPDFNGDTIPVIGKGSSGDLTLYAKFINNTYTIKYDQNKPENALNAVTGITVDSKHNYDVSSPLSQNGFKLYGWKHIGWCLKSDGSDKLFTELENVINLTDKSNEVITLYAQWSQKEYAVKYNPNKPNNATGLLEGHMVDSLFKYDNSYTLPENSFTLEGWHFVGWNTSYDGTGSSYSDEETVINIPANEGLQIELFAQWEANAYTVHYDKNKPMQASHNVENEMADSNHIFNTDSRLNQNKFTLYGWRFNGWNTKADGTGRGFYDNSLVTDLGDKKLNNQTVTLYAQWQPLGYTVIYTYNRPENASHLVLGSMATSIYYYDFESKLTKNCFTLQGWNFIGWRDSYGNNYADQATVKTPTLNVNNELMLVAKWQPYNYSVKYYANPPADADIISGSMSDSYFKYDNSATLSASGYSVTGWRFTGWNTASNGSGTNFNVGQSYTNIKTDITDNEVVPLYAQWEKQLYTITLDKNGGSGGTSSIQLFYKGALPSITAPTKTGYSFNGYYATVNGNSVLYYDRNMNKMITEWRDVQVTKLTARWNVNDYFITFNKNGGEGGSNSLRVYYGYYPDIIEIPTKFGYEFVGYYLEGRIIESYKYYDSNGYATQTYRIQRDVELVACYEPVLTYKINAWAQGTGSGDEYHFTDIRIDWTTRLTAWTVQNYEFKGWYWTPGMYNERSEFLTNSTDLEITESMVTDWLKQLSAEGGRILAYNVYALYDTNCVVEDTLITLADGSQKAVQDLNGDEQLLVWNLETGSFDTAPILFIDSDPLNCYEVIKLSFSDNTEVEVVGEHGFWDFNLNKYVYLDSQASQYIGHWFNKQITDSSGNLTWIKVQLVGVDIYEKYTTTWSPVTYSHLCYYVNGMLSMPGGISGLFNMFEVDSETMKYDEAKKQADIEKYGLYTFEEFAEIIPVSEAVFNAFNGYYLKIAIGKGIIDLDTLKVLVERYSEFLIL